MLIKSGLDVLNVILRSRLVHYFYFLIAFGTLFLFILINILLPESNGLLRIVSSNQDNEFGNVHLLSVTCGNNCGSYKEKNDVGALIRSIIAFGRPALNINVHFHLVLSTETFYNCTDRITKSIQPWLDQDENVNSWFKLHYLSYDSLIADLKLTGFDEILMNGYRQCTGFRNFVSSMEYFSNISKMVYLDTDVAMFNSAERVIEEWNGNWTKEQMIGVIGSGGRLFRGEEEVNLTQGLFRYGMNAGVMFFDLDKMRRNNFFANFRSLIQSGKKDKIPLSNDQVQLNYFCHVNSESCREVDCGFNLVNGNYGKYCLPKFKSAEHAVFIHKNWGMHNDYYKILNASNDLQWVRQFYATNMSLCQVERFTMRNNSRWKHKYPETWKDFGGIGCPQKN